MFLDKLIGPDLKKLKANYTFCDKRDGAHGIEHGNVYEFPPLKADDMVMDDELVW
jgi:hypothetical protein